MSSTLKVNIRGPHVDLGNISGAVTLNASGAELYSGTLTDDVVLTVEGSGTVGFVAKQDAIGGHTVTFGGSPLTIGAAPNAWTLVEFWPLPGSGRRAVYPGAASGGGTSAPAGVTFDNAPSKPAEGQSASLFVTSAVVWPAGVVWSTEPDNAQAPVIAGSGLVSLFTVGGTTYGVLSATYPAATPGGSDTTPPTVGSMAASNITTSSMTLTVSGAADAGGLHAQPYAFTTNGGASWSPYQSSPVYNATGLTGATTYSVNWRVRDAAMNVRTGTARSESTASPTPLTVALGGSTAVAAKPGTTYTWTAAPIGTASATRRVIVAVSAYLNGTPTATVSALTIGGVTANRDVYATRDGRNTIELWSAVVPSGSTADVALTLTANPAHLRLATVVVDGGASTVADAAVEAPSAGFAATVTPAPGGQVIALASAYNGSVATVTWSGGVAPLWTPTTSTGIWPSIATMATTSAADVSPAATYSAGSNRATVAVAVVPA